jgi:hypothetical protein
MRRWTGTSLAWVLLACSAQTPDDSTASVDPTACDGSAGLSQNGPAHYTSVRATVISLLRPVGLCELAQFYSAGAGFYRVAQMTGFLEEIPRAWNPELAKGTMAGFTYVDLELVEAWTTDAPKNPRVRIEGGPSGLEGGCAGGFSIHLAVDETVGILIEEASPRNADQLGLHELTVFHRDASRRFSNGQLTFAAPELTKHVHDVFEDPASVDCNALKPPAQVFEDVPPMGTDIPGPPGEVVPETSESGPGEPVPEVRPPQSAGAGPGTDSSDPGEDVDSPETK